MLSNKVAVGLIALVALAAAGAGTYLASCQPVAPAKSSPSRRHPPLRSRTERSRPPKR